MLIYLSVPYEGRSNIHKLAILLLREGYQIAMPCRYRYELRDWCSDSDYNLLQRCDAIYFATGWVQDAACQREMHHAINLKKRIFIENHVEPV